MKNKIPVSMSRIILALFLLTALLPVGIWLFRNETNVVITNPAPSEKSEINPLLLWPFYNLKSTFSDGAAPRGKNSFFILSDSFPASGSESEARLSADEQKDTALSHAFLIADSAPLSDLSHSLYRNYLEQFLRIKRTGWSLVYNRENIPSLKFVHEDGRKVILEGGIHFDGTPPSAGYEGRSALIYQRVSQYIPEEPVTVSSALDMHLTAEGRKVLENAGIPEEVPLLMEQISPLIHTGFISVDFTHSSIVPGSFRVAGKIWYRSRMSLFRNGSEEKLYWRVAVPWIKDLIQKAGEQPGPVLADKSISHQFTTQGSRFYHSVGGDRSPFFIKGINLGTALPGTWFTQFPEDELLYYNWFTRMKKMNFNTLRVYTLLPPSFYRALKLYNTKNSTDPLFILQEIWPEEHPAENNYLNREYSETYWNEIHMNIDGLHGNVQIPVRTGRAWGNYTSDVSPWILGYLIGREMEPDEVTETNRLNPDARYEGRYISALTGPATEAWLAESCDRAVSYEMSAYGSSRPVGIVSWPTLDTLNHPLEWKDPELQGKAPYNDRAEVDIRKITVADPSFGGLFGAYHIYPNYPDFMNNQSSYASYTDDNGSFRYGGYLAEFIQTHTGYPAIVAEYGLSTSKATAHFNPEGYDHGGLSETLQADGIIRMTEAIRKTGYTGAVIFEWMDEWAKKTWTTEPFMIPYDRQALWHNVLDPEQNYGIMAMSGSSHHGENRFESERTGKSVSLWGDEACLNIKLTSPVLWSRESQIFIGLDTNSLTDGLKSIPSTPPVEVTRGVESLVKIDLKSGSARFFNAENYNFATLRLSGKENRNSVFDDIEILVNRAYSDESGKKHAALTADWGTLASGPLDEPVHSLLIEDTVVTVRIPWGLMNVSDPSQGTLLFDERVFDAAPLSNEIRTIMTDGISVAAVIQDSSGTLEVLPDRKDEHMDFLSYTWTRWDVPAYEMRAKKSADSLSQYLGSF